LKRIYENQFCDIFKKGFDLMIRIEYEIAKLTLLDNIPYKHPNKMEEINLKINSM